MSGDRTLPACRLLHLAEALSQTSPRPLKPPDSPSPSRPPTPGGAAAVECGVKRRFRAPCEVRAPYKHHRSPPPPFSPCRHQPDTGLPKAAMLAALPKSRKRDQVEDAIGNNNTKRPQPRGRRATEVPGRMPGTVKRPSHTASLQTPSRPHYIQHLATKSLWSAA